MRIHHLILVLVLSAMPAVPAAALGRAGGCQSRCPSGQQLCTHDNGSATCVDLDRDRRHCGRCGNVCRTPDRCIDGRCQVENRCGRGQSYCQMPDGSQRCTDTGRDERHCGRCGNVCRKQDRCINGICTSDCPPGQTFCRRPDGTQGCTNTQTDRFNCGGCGQGCPSTRPTCRDGRCN